MNVESGCPWSEDSAFGPLGFTRVRDVNPGEAILITAEGKMISRQCVNGTISPCIFEYIYLARPDSTLNGISVYEFQLELGRRLARRIKDRDWEIDVVVPVPDGSRPSAIEIAHELEMPYREAWTTRVTRLTSLLYPPSSLRTPQPRAGVKPRLVFLVFSHPPPCEHHRVHHTSKVSRLKP